MGTTKRPDLNKPATINTTPLYLVIDQGGHASRAFIFNAQGQELSRGTAPIEAQISVDDRVEYEAETLLQSIQTAIHEAVSAPNIKLTEIVAAGMATQRSNVVCWDKTCGKPLSPIISWQDRRAADWIEKFQPNAAQIHQSTGLFLSPHYGVGKLQWCINNLSAVHEAHQQQRLCWGPMSSFLLHQLLDEQPYLVDRVNASRTLLLNINTLEWDRSLAQLFKLPHNPLPRCVPNHYPFGTLTIAGHAVPMTTVIGDQSASLFAWQQLQHDALYINIGTGAFIQRVTGDDCVIVPQLLTSLLQQQNGNSNSAYALEGTVNGAGSALSWIEQRLQPDRLYQKLPQWLENNDLSILFLNGVSGIGSPYWQADFESKFIGAGSVEQQITAVIESIAFLLQLNIEQLQHHRPGAKKILISGGLAQLDGLCQRIADLSGLIVHRMAECEATASGLAWLLVHSQPATIESTWHRHDQQQIQPQENPMLIKRYQRWHIAMDEATDS